MKSTLLLHGRRVSVYVSGQGPQASSVEAPDVCEHGKGMYRRPDRAYIEEPAGVPCGHPVRTVFALSEARNHRF